MISFDRPLLFLDLETTGTDVEKDRIVQVATIKVFDWQHQEEKKHLVDPGCPIPPAATAVHGITDEMVRGKPTFSRLARSLQGYIADSDIAGFNQRDFDMRMLWYEFDRAGVPWEFPEEHRAPDVMALFYHFHPRTLAAAVMQYVGVEHKDSHDALGDVRATRDVLWAILDVHGLTLDQATAICNEDRPLRLTVFDQWFEDAGNAELRFIRGKHKGLLLSELAVSGERDYLDWMLRKILDTKIQHAVSMAQIVARRENASAPRPPKVQAAEEPSDQESFL